jgi:hypothetical protein
MGTGTAGPRPRGRPPRVIELWIFDSDVKAKGLIPGQLLRVHCPDGRVYNITRFGADCIVGCVDPAEEKKGKT